MLFAACGITDAIMEHPGVIMGVYEYYGNQPFEFYKFPFYWSFTNGVAICTIGVLIYYVWPLVKDKGWWKLAILPLGIIGTTMGEFGAGFPVFLAINADIADLAAVGDRIADARDLADLDPRARRPGDARGCPRLDVLRPLPAALHAAEQRASATSTRCRELLARSRRAPRTRRPDGTKAGDGWREVPPVGRHPDCSRKSS